MRTERYDMAEEKTEKLGPCPLCGDVPNGGEDVHCFNDCSLYLTSLSREEWNRLSAMAASERRMRAALEEVGAILKSAAVWNGHEPKAVKVIDEALKGDEG